MILKLLAITLLSSLAILVASTLFANAGGGRSIVVQSTTSTQNSGLFEHILPVFEAESGIRVKVVAVGTGQALKNGRNGDGDVLLVHAKSSEDKFVNDGYGVHRYDVMYNDFIIVGPDEDPARIAGTKNVLMALKMIADGKFPFASRGDNSGTHKKELQLWSELNIDAARASGSWYRETGSGMGATLNLASGMGAYTMTDRGTWIAFNNKQSIKILSQGDKKLFNQYGIMLVNPKRHAHIKAAEGQAFIDWIIGEKGQAAINAYKLDGRQLFFGNAE